MNHDNRGTMSSLQEKKANFTKGLMFCAAAELSADLKVNELSFKKIAEHAGISERTMFRYFNSREEFLDAFAAQLHSELKLPTIPSTTGQLEDYVAQLFTHLEAQPETVNLLLDPHLMQRIINTTAKLRFEELKVLLIQDYPQCDETLITQSAANMRYVMSASSWRYYRENFGFDLPTSIQCASLVVSQALAFLDAQSIKQ